MKGCRKEARHQKEARRRQEVGVTFVLGALLGGLGVAAFSAYTKLTPEERLALLEALKRPPEPLTPDPSPTTGSAEVGNAE